MRREKNRDGLGDLRPVTALPKYRLSTYSHPRNDHLNRG